MLEHMVAVTKKTKDTGEKTFLKVNIQSDLKGAKKQKANYKGYDHLKK